MALPDALGYLLNQSADNSTISWSRIWGIYRESQFGGMGDWVYLSFVAMMSVAVFGKTESTEIMLMVWLIGSFVVGSYIPLSVLPWVFISSALILTSLIYKTIREEA